MSNYNLERGHELYFAELKKQASSNPNISEDILKLGALFGFNVGVMQEKAFSKDFNFDDDTCMLSYDWTPSYKKLSSGVVAAAQLNNQSEEKMSYRQMIEKVFDFYPKHISHSTENTKVNSEIAKETNEIAKNAEQFHNFSYQTITVEKDGKEVEVEVAFDDIDLLEEFDDEDLTVEGERSLGIISTDFDTTDGSSPERKTRNQMSRGTAKLIKKIQIDPITNSEVVVEDFEITCPYTGSTEVYQVSSSVYASYETDQHFKVDLNLADLNLKLNEYF